MQGEVWGRLAVDACPKHVLAGFVPSPVPPALQGASMTHAHQHTPNKYFLVREYLQHSVATFSTAASKLTALILRIEDQKTIMEQEDFAPVAHNLERLQVARSVASKSLTTKQEAREHWTQAQFCLERWLSEDKEVLTIADICVLHACVCGKVSSKLRDVAVFVGPTQLCDPRELKECMEQLVEEIFQNTLAAHPVLRAAALRQWFLAIHPFDDANGRTAQLLADYILLKEGYLPQSFNQSVEGICGLTWGESQRVFMTPETAFLAFARSVLNSYSILGGI